MSDNWWTEEPNKAKILTKDNYEYLRGHSEFDDIVIGDDGNLYWESSGHPVREDQVPSISLFMEEI